MTSKNPDPTALHEHDFLQQFPHHDKHAHAEADTHAKPRWWEFQPPQGYAKGGLVSDRLKALRSAVKALPKC